MKKKNVMNHDTYEMLENAIIDFLEDEDEIKKTQTFVDPWGLGGCQITKLNRKEFKIMLPWFKRRMEEDNYRYCMYIQEGKNYKTAIFEDGEESSFYICCLKNNHLDWHVNGDGDVNWWLDFSWDSWIDVDEVDDYFKGV